MNTSAILDDPQGGTEHGSEIEDRIGRLENELAEVRHRLGELADIVVGDIQERREVAASVSAPISEIQIPASLVPGGKFTMGAVNAFRRPWLLWDLFKELWTSVRMYIDPRYRVRRATQMMVPVVLGLVVANYFFFGVVFWSIPIVTPILEHLVTIVLAVLLYKILAREVARYRTMLVQIASGTKTIRSIPAALLNNEHDLAPPHRQETG